ncbi:CidA/LrgA family protein [Glaciimonas sp. CA11.2]|uniref:CidA/LrgA family protein n=1 Tax=unclassified Glaciimonas TaxID=2644401 RepID=UPI002AB46ECC|nr:MULTISPECIES: CidA/LrgA family protein [unclassified Glaciimonas]MDY7548093.1 CidA/LrgA family protein [Glaciimonas sp. CA11.2]MEB0010260.1 CidA/LrgA family protein [Glaciimonas sp. Cout2]MEB0083759.1 CidA/LrgA family protein [Glaciimonas sp. Gout2]MEB0165331.1 CidA/LrgA family protein [Glaciimonas sp. CA11.2]
MLATFATLLIFQCLGEGITFALSLPIPGPVVGMLLLFVALVISPGLLERIEKTGTELLGHLSLLFVPAGVGIVVSAATVRGHWLAVIVSVIVSTILTLAVTATAIRLTMPAQRKARREPDAELQGESGALDKHKVPKESDHA